MARRYEVETIDRRDADDVPEPNPRHDRGPRPDSVLEAVGMEAHGAPFGRLAQAAAGFLPDAVAQPLIEKAAIDRMSALYDCFD